jgi:hypothetical protein
VTTYNEDEVINIDNKYYEMDSYFLGINIRVRMTSRKISIKKKVVHFFIPSSRSFIKTIKRFFKDIKKDRVIPDISKRFFHVDLLSQIPMQEIKFGIHLMDLAFV